MNRIRICNCLLCGVRVLDTAPTADERWLQEYRIVYRDGEDAFITGVALYDGTGEWKAPQNPFTRWDAMTPPDVELTIPILHQLPVDYVHGFIIHDSCWVILQKAGDGTSISLSRLVCVCESLACPFWFNGLYWGHDYGGFASHPDPEAPPWIESFEEWPLSKLYAKGFMADPVYESVIGILLSTPTQYPQAPKLLWKGTDVFSRLPWDVCEIIATNLPTKDVFNLRLASRTFVPIFSSFAFWLSRFEAQAERGFIFDIGHPPRITVAGELLRLHHLSRESKASPALLNRKRVWQLAQRLLPLIKPLTGQSECGQFDGCQSQQLPESEHWIRIAGDEQPPVPIFLLNGRRQGCRSLRTVVMDVPVGTFAIKITTVHVDDQGYVSGIKLISEDGREQLAGYEFDETGRIHNSEQNNTIYNVTALYGLRVAMGPDGVRALQVIGQAQEAFAWRGNKDRQPISDRLVSNTRITKLGVSFDGYKVTALSIPIDQSRFRKTAQAAQTDLRHTALWYPEVPPEELLLNESSFAGQEPLSTAYQPLVWRKFGGESGKSLAHIKAIRSQEPEKLYGLRVEYDETHKIRYSEEPDQPEEEGLPSETALLVDGAGGERIDSVAVGIWRYGRGDSDLLRYGKTESIIIGTNRDRAVRLGRNTKDGEWRQITVEDGTTMTGYYGHWDPDYGMASLGVISERILDEPCTK